MPPLTYVMVWSWAGGEPCDAGPCGRAPHGGRAQGKQTLHQHTTVITFQNHSCVERTLAYRKGPVSHPLCLNSWVIHLPHPFLLLVCHLPQASLKLGKGDDVTLPWGETLLAKPLIRLNAAAIPPALADLLGKRRGTL